MHLNFDVTYKSIVAQGHDCHIWTKLYKVSHLILYFSMQYQD